MGGLVGGGVFAGIALILGSWKFQVGYSYKPLCVHSMAISALLHYRLLTLSCVFQSIQSSILFYMFITLVNRMLEANKANCCCILGLCVMLYCLHPACPLLRICAASERQAR